MKAVLARQELFDGLSAVSTVVSGRTTRPILGCVRLRIGEAGLELSATDGEAALRVPVEVLSVERPGEAVVPVQDLLPVVRELDDAELSVEADDRHCVVCGQGSEFRIFLMAAADFPPVGSFDGEPDLVVDGDLLRRMIALTVYAAARETSRYAINGVLWQKRGRRLFLVATDGRRLARAGGEVRASAAGDFEVILPSKAMGVFEKVFAAPRGDGPWEVQIRVTPNQVLLRTGGRVLSSVLVEGSFPKYEDVIPKEHTREARLPREAFLQAVRRAALLTTEESRAVRLAFEGELLVITSQAPDRGQARVDVPLDYRGEPLVIGFNPVFLTEALRAIPYEEIVLELDENFRPGVLRGEDAEEFLYVVMPVSLTT